MGLFGRKKDSEGFYTGDAPVSAPGFDGAAPGAYDGQPFQDHAGPAPAGPTVAASEGGYRPPIASGPNAAGPQDSAVPRHPGDPSSPAVSQIRTLDPATAARVQQQLSQVGRRLSKLGCLLIAIPVVGALVGVGFAVYAAIHATGGARDALNDAIAGRSSTVAEAPEGRNLGVTALGEPVSIRTKDATYDVTVFGAETQIGSGWGYVSAGDGRVLVVDAQVTRTDTGALPVEFTGWNWSVAGTDRRPVRGDIISHFEPSLDGPELIGGQSVRGYVVFDTPLTAAVLAVSDGLAGAALAAWTVTAATPATVEGVFGEPVRAEISRPGFTVVIGAPEVIPASDSRVGHPPASGQYLVIPVTFSGVPDADGHLGTVDKDAFVLTPTGAPAMFAEFAGVDGSFSFVSIDAAAPEQGYLAFDTAATSGRLELRNGADKPVIRWQIGG